jgi:tungstate transport system ATP-binding protein
MKLELHVSKIHKVYNGSIVLRDCSFAFDHPGVYVLTGPNGCGKSTFLRICDLLEKPDGGEIVYVSHGVPLQQDIALRRRMALVLPKVGIFNSTVFNNAAYGLKVRGAPKREVRERVNRYLESFGLLDKINQNALTLSSGETQRLGIARAMITEPDILFLDEPTASVDAKNCMIIEEIILDMKEKGFPTVIMTTHDVGQAERLADILLRMEDGRIISV